MLLYGSGLPAQYWLAALVHAAYIHSQLVHSTTHKTLFKAWFGRQPNLCLLRIFGSRVCVKQSGERCAKLDHHHINGMFIGYTAADHNNRYIDVNSGLMKRSHHAVFDEVWYLQPS